MFYRKRENFSILLDSGKIRLNYQRMNKYKLFNLPLGLNLVTLKKIIKDPLKKAESK